MKKLLLAFLLIPSICFAQYGGPFGSGANNLGLKKGTYTDGDVCTYTASGTKLNCNTNPSGTGTVTSVAVASPNATLQSVGGTNPITGGGTINLDVNWNDVNKIASINSGGINWQDVTINHPINSGGINWTSFPASGLAKFNGSSSLVSALSGTDYLPATTGTQYQLLASSGSGGITNITLGTGLTNVLGTLSATGAVNSVSNSDSSLTISPTTGSVIASINLGHSNTWTAGQTFSVSPIISTATVSTPAIFNSSKQLISGAYAGNTTTLATTSGTFTSGNIRKSDGNSNEVDAGVSFGTLTNNDVCIYSSSGTVINCTGSASGTGTVTSIGATSPNSTIQISSSPVVSSGNIGYDVNWNNVNSIANINSGGLNWSSLNSLATINSSGLNWQNINLLKTITTGINWPAIIQSVQNINVNWYDVNKNGSINVGGINWANVNGTASINKIGINWTNFPATGIMQFNGQTSPTAITIGSNLTFTGGTLSANTSGSGTVTSVGINSPNSTIITTSSPVTTSGTIGQDINWSNVNAIATIAMGGINWYDAAKLTQGVNWYQVSLITSTVATNGSGVGGLKMYDSSGINWIDIQAPSTISGTHTWNWMSNDGTNGQFVKTDGSGNLSFATASGSGTVNSGTSGELSYYASTGAAVSTLADSSYSSSFGLTIAQSVAGAYGFVANNTNASGLAIIDVQDTTTSLLGGEVQTGSSYALPNAFGVGTFSAEPMYILMNSAPIALYDTAGNFYTISSVHPVASSCGSSPSMSSGATNNSGAIIIGTGATTTSCTVTFANSGWSSAPNCVVSDDTNILTIKPSTSSTILTITSTTTMSTVSAGDHITYICQGNV